MMLPLLQLIKVSALLPVVGLLVPLGFWARILRVARFLPLGVPPHSESYQEADQEFSPVTLWINGDIMGMLSWITCTDELKVKVQYVIFLLFQRCIYLKELHREMLQ